MCVFPAFKLQLAHITSQDWLNLWAIEIDALHDYVESRVIASAMESTASC
jgi:hypothetical protein